MARKKSKDGKTYFYVIRKKGSDVYYESGANPKEKPIESCKLYSSIARIKAHIAYNTGALPYTKETHEVVKLELIESEVLPMVELTDGEIRRGERRRQRSEERHAQISKALVRKHMDKIGVEQTIGLKTPTITKTESVSTRLSKGAKLTEKEMEGEVKEEFYTEEW